MKPIHSVKQYIFMVICTLLCVGFSYAQTLPQQYITDVTSAFTEKQIHGNLTNVQQTIDTYCDVVLDKGKFVTSGSNARVYDARQSVFVYALCSYDRADGLGEKYQNYFPETFTPDIFSGLTYPNMGFDKKHCLDDFSMKQCDMVEHTSEMYHTIMSALVDIKQSAVFGVYTTEAKLDEAVNNFTTNHFLGLQLCEKGGDCPYKQTHKNVQQYMKKARQTLQRVSYVMPDLLYDVFIQDACTAVDDETYNIVLCGLYSNTTSMKQFVTLTYNEFLYYRLFLTYYNTQIQLNNALEPTASDTLKYQQRQFATAHHVQQQITRAQQALSTSTRMLREMYITFPIHVGLLVYYEELQGFRDELVQIVTPIYTLFDKLRNVQVAEDE